MTTVILCNGREPDKVMIHAATERADLFIAADGGADTATRLGLHPDLIIGDLDSYSGSDDVRRTLEGDPSYQEDLSDQGNPSGKHQLNINREGAGDQTVIFDPDQETNDLEKALELALKRSAETVLVFGAIGLRVDHTLKNLSVLKRFNASFADLRFIDNYGELILLPKSYSKKMAEGTRISLYPLSGRVQGITTSGLKYPLDNEFLEIGIRDGTSNETSGGQIEISHEKGDLLLFIATKPDFS